MFVKFKDDTHYGELHKKEKDAILKWQAVHVLFTKKLHEFFFFV